MKKISKLIAFVLVLVLGVILVACGNKGGDDNTATTGNKLTAENIMPPTANKEKRLLLR